jgi:hypothetical protein
MTAGMLHVTNLPTPRREQPSSPAAAVVQESAAQEEVEAAEAEAELLELKTAIAVGAVLVFCFTTNVFCYQM